MPMVERIKAICLKPNTEWPVIEGEATCRSPRGSRWRS
jgi:hypothetical protein